VITSVVAIDGPAGSGKSTVAQALARALGLRSLDSGLLYRVVAQAALMRQIDADNAELVTALAKEMLSALVLRCDADCKTVITLLGLEVTEGDLHSSAISQVVPIVARHERVRRQVRQIQRNLIAQGRVIIAGRDIGIVVAPNADLKLYLDVSLAERAARRVWASSRGAQVSQALVERMLSERDQLDRERSVSPMRIPSDAFVLRTDGLSVPETVAMIVTMCGLQPHLTSEVQNAEVVGQ
jgi:cytidylate kinase